MEEVGGRYAWSKGSRVDKNFGWGVQTGQSINADRFLHGGNMHGVIISARGICSRRETAIRDSRSTS